MLEVLGLDAEAETIYRTMLNHPRNGVAELAALLGFSEERVCRGLDKLSESALVLPSQRESAEFCAVSPEAAIAVLLARRQADLAVQQSQVEEFRVDSARLIAEWSALRPNTADKDHEQLLGIEAIRARLARFADEAQEEYATFAPGGGHSTEDLMASRRPNEVLFARGIRVRSVYLDSVRNHQPTLEHINWLGEGGGRVRTVPTLPIRMIIVDRRQAVLPIDTTETRAGAVVLKGAGTVAALYALFESVWNVAVPLGNSPQYDSDAMPPQERAVLSLLTQGLTDAAIAKRLGVSPRTARRTAAELMERLHARSRFEAGVHAVQDGWLPAER